MIGLLREEFEREVDKAIAAKTEHIAMGKAESFERYKELAGEIRGLVAAKKVLVDVIKKHGREETDE